MYSSALNPVSDSVVSFTTPGTDNVLSRSDISLRAARSRIVLNPVNGEVFVNGTHADNTVSINKLGADQVRVVLVGIELRDFDISDVNSFRVLGRNGNDEVVNGTAIPMKAYGQNGNDTILGSHGNDFLDGGSGMDVLDGRAGDDQLFGKGGADHLVGGPGDDWISGASGNDTILGQGGNDRVTGDSGHDTVNGGPGNDSVWGWTGNDALYGESGNDLIFGNDGADIIDAGTGNDIVRGGDQDDIIQGGTGADWLYGDRGNDVLRSTAGVTMFYGNQGDDEIHGSPSNDRLHGGDGDDRLFGGNGDDQLRGFEGSDFLDGQGGNDLLSGGNGHDQLEGGSGNDLMFGDRGNDQLTGGSGIDDLRGGSGNDVLLGGPGNARDVLRGESGQDHILYFQNNIVADHQGDDLRIRFVNKGSAWTTGEVRVINDGLNKLHQATGNSRLVQDRLTGDDLSLVKVASLGGATAQNVLRYKTVGGKTVYERVIQFADWNENNQPLNDARIVALVHEIAHNFDDEVELAATPDVSINDWNNFRQLSGWRTTDPENPAYARSGDGQWWYLKSSQFFRSYSTVSAYEDWATVWELFFDETADRPDPVSNLGRKLGQVTAFIGKLG